jgi:hypothetical protein
MSQLYERCRQAIMSRVANQKLSLTSDIWTAEHSIQSFVSMSGHWIDDEFKRSSVLLTCQVITDRHTGEVLGEQLLQILKSWNLSLLNIHILLRDNAANMIKASQISGIQSTSCFLHTLQLVITDSLFQQSSISIVLTVCRQIVTHFKHSSAATARLKEIQNELSLPQHQLIQDVSTRWSSTLLCLERLLEQRRACTIYCAEYNAQTTGSTRKIITPSPQQWLIIENVIQLLKPFEQLTLEMSSDTATLSMIIPSVQMLTHNINQVNVYSNTGIKTLKHDLLAALNKRFQTIMKGDLHVVSTFLDPRFKSCLSDSQVLQIQTALHASIQYTPNETVPVATISKTSCLEGSIWDSWENTLNSLSVAQSSLHIHSPLETEITTYLSESRPQIKSDPLHWWKVNSKKYPILSDSARQYLSAPASSIFSERIFSAAGRILDDSRSTMSGENVERLLFLKYNL